MSNTLSNNNLGVKDSDRKQIRKKDYYGDTYTIREQGRGVITTVPKQVVERVSRRKSMSVEAFLLTHDLRVFYDDFDGMDYGSEFVEKSDEEKIRKLKGRISKIKGKMRDEDEEIDEAEANRRIIDLERALKKVKEEVGD